MNELRILTPCGGLGYGFPEASIAAGMARKPHLIAVDSGSTDPGPHYLGSGEGMLSLRNDLEALLRVRQEANIPLVVGSADIAGAKPHLNRTVELVKEIAARNGYRLKLAVISADIDPGFLKDAIASGRVEDFEHPDTLTNEAVDRSSNIVGQMGVEPHIAALESGADVVIAGRSYDPALIAALPIMRGFDPGLALHMGKILECGAYAAEPSVAADAMLGTIRDDHFVVEPLNPVLRCTVDSVAAHTMYEKQSPVHLYLPGGMLDLSQTEFEAISDRAVRVTGSSLQRADTYTVKLEGAAQSGFRSLFIAGAREPAFISQIDSFVEMTRARVRDGVKYSADDYQLVFRVYGNSGVTMTGDAPAQAPPDELGIIGEVVAKTQQMANEICCFAHGVMMHSTYPGRKTIAGNLAFPYSPSDFDLGPVYEFNIYHLLQVDDPVSLFPLTVQDL